MVGGGGQFQGAGRGVTATEKVIISSARVMPAAFGQLNFGNSSKTPMESTKQYALPPCLSPHLCSLALPLLWGQPCGHLSPLCKVILTAISKDFPSTFFFPNPFFFWISLLRPHSPAVHTWLQVRKSPGLP